MGDRPDNKFRSRRHPVMIHPTCPVCKKNDRVQKHGTKFFQGELTRYYRCMRCHKSIH